MLVYERPEFNSAFPEEFNWARQTSVKLEAAARVIVAEIHADFKTPERLLVPGLRAALIVLSKVAEFYEG